MSDLSFYQSRRDEMRKAAEEATLANVRERCERAAAAFAQLADRAERAEHTEVRDVRRDDGVLVIGIDDGMPR